MIQQIIISPFIKLLLMTTCFSIALAMVSIFLPLPGADIDARSNSSLFDQTQDVRSENIKMKAALARPLFHENRRPPRPAPKHVAAKPILAAPTAPDLPFTLAGIVTSGDNNFKAYLQNTRTAETIVIESGDSAGEWSVKIISAQSVTLEAGTFSHILKLNERS
jgi:hypothetical protein